MRLTKYKWPLKTIINIQTKIKLPFTNRCMVFILLGLFAVVLTGYAQKNLTYNLIKPGGEWLHTDEVHIDCHGGNIIYVNHLKTY